MPSTFYNIQTGLDKTLARMAGLPSVAWANGRYVPVLGTSYLKPHLIPATSDLFTLNNEKRNYGIYQVDIFTPAEKGMNEGLKLADEIKTHFEANKRISQNDDTIFVKAISLGNAERREAWNYIYVEIVYECFS